ncbi:hypothetical protein PC120_g22383 [Phytophthora cactorum]|nr:hypothetical protein PC120_g22383 [Phytophthora cactorum]
MYSIPPRSPAADLFVPNEGDYYHAFCAESKPVAQDTRTWWSTSPAATLPPTTTSFALSSDVKEASTLEHLREGEDAQVHLPQCCERVDAEEEHIFSQVVVQASIKKRLSGKKVGFAIDTWTEDGTHFVAIIGITELEKILLRFAALENDAVISSDAIIDLLDDVLDMYGTEVCF